MQMQFLATENVSRPKIVCLCGSTKFKEEYIKTAFIETMKGHIVLSVGWFSHADGNIFTPSRKEKAMLDVLHFAKIDLADEVIIISVDGYIGESTEREIEYAKMRGKPVSFIEDLRSGKEQTHFYT